MAKASDEAELWLHDKENNKNGVITELVDAEFGFPSEFPYEFDSFGLEPLSSPPVESVAGSTEAESSDEEDFSPGLTRWLSQATIHETRNQQLSSVPITNSDKAEVRKTLNVSSKFQNTVVLFDCVFLCSEAVFSFATKLTLFCAFFMCCRERRRLGSWPGRPSPY